MPAHVRDIDAIREFRAALVRFSEELAGTLDALRIELQRIAAWIEQDRPFYWTGQVRRAFDKVAETRTALTTCQMRTVAGRHPSCIEEKVACEKAKHRLQHCQQQVERVKRWEHKLAHDSDEFRGRLAGLQRLLEGDIPRMLALLEKISTILESYADVSPPMDRTSEINTSSPNTTPDAQS